MVTAAELEVLTAAIATPYDASGAVDAGKLDALVQHYRDRGVEGIYCCGSSGEGLLLDADERTLVVETAVKASEGRIPVVAHVGAIGTRESIALAKRAQDAGAVAVSMIPPIYYHYPREAVIAHYRAVMDAIDIPMIVYNIPQFTGTEFTADSAAELLSDDRVIGVKQTAHNMFTLAQMRNRFPDKAYINGFDEVFLAALAAGARGTIGTTVGMQVELFIAIRRLLDAGDLAGAQRVQAMVNEIIAELVAIDVFPAAKYVSGRVVGDLGPARAPFAVLDADARRRLDALGERMDDCIAEASRI